MRDASFVWLIPILFYFLTTNIYLFILYYNVYTNVSFFQIFSYFLCVLKYLVFYKKKKIMCSMLNHLTVLLSNISSLAQIYTLILKLFI